MTKPDSETQPDSACQQITQFRKQYQHLVLQSRKSPVPYSILGLYSRSPFNLPTGTPFLFPLSTLQAPVSAQSLLRVLLQCDSTALSFGLLALRRKPEIGETALISGFQLQGSNKDVVLFSPGVHGTTTQRPLHKPPNVKTNTQVQVVANRSQGRNQSDLESDPLSKLQRRLMKQYQLMHRFTTVLLDTDRMTRYAYLSLYFGHKALEKTLSVVLDGVFGMLDGESGDDRPEE